MLPRSQLLLRVTSAAALGVAVVAACGPFFGIEALQRRKQVLLAPPKISFDTELKALVPAPTDKLQVVESGDHGQKETTRETVEEGELSPSSLALVKAMREQGSGKAAFALGKGLPPAIRLYTAGAVSFLHSQTEPARTYFQAVLSLPVEQRQGRDLWARFMLGRLAVLGGQQSEAAAQFEAARALVHSGMPDQLGLALASFGEQARGAWNQNLVADAVNLYARQASYGSQTALNSLVTIAGLILSDQKILDQGIQDPLTRRLLFIYANGNSDRMFFIRPPKGTAAGSTIDRIMGALERHPLNLVEGAGQLASAAYYQGRFDLAQKFSAMEDVPMSAWVMAKLALRKGDRESALRAYQKALKGFRLGDSARIGAEVATLQVSRGEYLQALGLFYRAASSGVDSSNYPDGFSDYWGDAAYLAERVLTLEELQDYVDHNLSPTSGSTSNGSTSGEKFKGGRLRSVLARRLMRAGRRREALRYFDDQKIRDAAERYDSALNKAASWWRPRLTRAEAWFTAAKLARKSGLQLLGFEQEPDFAMWEGNFTPFDSNYGQAAGKNQETPANAYQTDDERKRVAASKPERDVRFQYRLTAVDHAMKSADLLPASSQAFAAVLCESTKWVIDRQPERTEQIYQRYLHNGAYVPWGRTFGRQCPEPNFIAASGWSTASRQAKRLTRRAGLHPVFGGVLVAVALAIFATLIFHWRTWRAGHLPGGNENSLRNP